MVQVLVVLEEALTIATGQQGLDRRLQSRCPLFIRGTPELV